MEQQRHWWWQQRQRRRRPPAAPLTTLSMRSVTRREHMLRTARPRMVGSLSLQAAEMLSQEIALKQLAAAAAGLRRHCGGGGGGS